MALSVDYVYKFALNLIRKNQSSGLVSTEFAYHWNAAQSAYQSDLMGRFQPRGIGKVGANTGLIENETILTKLTPFIMGLVNQTVTAGQYTKPTDFLYTLAMRINGAAVFEVNHDEVWSLNDDVIDPPSIPDNSYYYTEYQNYYSISPATVALLDLDYIQAPTDVFWNYNLDANNRQVYNATGSTQPQWDNNSCREITMRMLKTIGVAFKDRDFEQFGQSVQTTGE